jgi:hypothetical protein
MTTSIISLCSHESVNRPIDSYNIKLFRDEFGWDDSHIGTVTVPREGCSNTRTWTNAGSGTYFFVFVKADDGARVWSDLVHMWGT